MKTSQRGKDAIASPDYEGIRLKAYPDPATGAEPWTIGVGHTGGVKPGDLITHEQAMEFLASDLQKAESAVNNSVRVPITQNQFDSLVSLAFNIGGGAFANSTLVRMLNLGDKLGAANQFTRWNKGNGKILKGLVKRRALERAMFLEAS